MATQVAIEDLETWLGNQSENTVDTPYEIEITGLTVNNVNNIKTAMKSSSARNKYVDLRDTDLPVGLTDVTSLFEQIYTLVYSPVFPEGITMFRQCFSDCTNLKEAPVIPSSAINIPYMFSNCSSLIVPPDIPESVKNMQGTFADCTGITKAKKFPNTITVVQSAYDGCYNLSYKPLIPNTAVLTEDCYRGVTTTRWGGSLEQVNSWIPNQTNEFDVVVIDTEREIYGVDVSNFATWLSEHDANTTDTPYEIKILNISSSVYPSVKTALLSNSTKYVDLGYTVIDYMTVLSGNYQNCTSLVGAPTFGAGTDYLDSLFRGCSNLKKVPPLPSSVVSLSMTFEGCYSLEEPVTIPSGVTNISYMFLNCVSLQSAPTIPDTVTSMRSAFQGCVLLNDDNIVIPDSVTNMQSSFNGCISLESIKEIPSSVTVMIDAFYNCASLRKIELFEVPLNTLKNNSNFENAFEGCTSLEQIGYKIDETDWHVYHLHFEDNMYYNITVSGKVYGVNNGMITEKTIPQTGIGESQEVELILKLPDYTDELWFPEAGEQIENTIQKMLTYKYGVFNKEVLQPDQKNFVLWAQDPNNFKTNVPITAVDFIQQGNMSPVTSNAVAGAFDEFEWEDISSKVTLTKDSGGTTTKFTPELLHCYKSKHFIKIGIRVNPTASISAPSGNGNLRFYVQIDGIYPTNAFYNITSLSYLGARRFPVLWAYNNTDISPAGWRVLFRYNESISQESFTNYVLLPIM